MKDILELNKVTKKYQAKNGELEAIRDVSFSVKNGEFVSIIGLLEWRTIYDNVLFGLEIRRKKR